MKEVIQWPAGEFTIQELIVLNRGLPEASIRQMLAAATKAGSVVRTQKGNHKIKGKFQVVKPGS